MATKEDKPEEPEADDIEGIEGEAAKTDEISPHEKKRSNRWTNMMQARAEAETAAKNAREELERERAERARIDRELAEMRGRMTERDAQASAAKQIQAADDYQKQIDALEDEAHESYKNGDYKGGRRAEAQIRDLERKRATADARAELMAEFEKKYPKQDPAAQAQAVEDHLLNSEFGGFASNDRWMKAAAGYMHILIGAKGQANNLETKRQAVKMAAADLGIQLPGSGQDNSTQRRLYGAVSGGSNGVPTSGGETSFSDKERKVIDMMDNFKDRGITSAEFEKRLTALRKSKAAR